MEIYIVYSHSTDEDYDGRYIGHKDIHSIFFDKHKAEELVETRNAKAKNRWATTYSLEKVITEDEPLDNNRKTD